MWWFFKAKDKVSQAKAYAGEVKKSVDKAMEDIVNIMRELNNLPEIGKIIDLMIIRVLIFFFEDYSW